MTAGIPRRIASAMVLGFLVVVLRAPCVEAQVVGPAVAQTPRAPVAPQPSPASRWEIEGYGGLVLAGLTPFGSRAIPPPGDPLTTSGVLFPTRQTSSWFFGDGAALVNDVSAEFDLPERIAPLDAALGSLGLGVARAGGGLRLRRNLTPRLSAEFGLDLSRGPGISGTLTSAVHAARDSFAPAFTALLATGPFTGVAVNATSAIARGSGAEASATGALNLHLRARGAFVPYATIGAGVTVGTNHLPSVTLDGDYRFSVLADVPIHEHDRVAIRYAGSSGLMPVGVIGGGLRRDLSARWGWRVDGRLVVGGHGARLLIDATPSILPGSPAGFVESLTNPNIQFSNNPSTGRRSTLGGSPLVGFVAFDEHVRMRVLVTIGVFRKF